MQKKILCSPKEEISFYDFIKRFPDGDRFSEYFETDAEHFEKKICLRDYMVINHCNMLPAELSFRRHPLYFCGQTSGEIKNFKSISVKYPTFLEALIYNVIDGFYFTYEQNEQLRCELQETFDTWFALVLDCNEQCLTKEYPEKTLLGIEVDKNKKTVTLFDPATAIERFHELYCKSTAILQ